MLNRSILKLFLVASSFMLSGQFSFGQTCADLFRIDTRSSPTAIQVFHKGSALEIATEAINRTTTLEKRISDMSSELQITNDLAQGRGGSADRVVPEFRTRLENESAQDFRGFLGSIANYEPAFRYLSTIAEASPDLRNSFKVIADLWNKVAFQVGNFEFSNAKNTLRDILSAQERIAKEIERLRSP